MFQALDQKNVQNSSVNATSQYTPTQWPKSNVADVTGYYFEGGGQKQTHAREADMLQWHEALWRQKRTFLSSCHTQDCNSTGILPITEWDLILTDGADELRCAAGFFYSSSAEILKTFSWAFFPIMIWAFSHTAAHASSCPGSSGLPWPPEALTLAHLSLWKTRPWLFVLFSFFLLASHHRHTHALLWRFSCWFQTWKKKHVLTSLMEFEEAQQETGAQGSFMVDWQHWDCSGLLTSMTPVKHLCILK